MRGFSREQLRCTYDVVIVIADFGLDSKGGSKPIKG
jgi:hypothetical protein